MNENKISVTHFHRQTSDHKNVTHFHRQTSDHKNAQKPTGHPLL